MADGIDHGTISLGHDAVEIDVPNEMSLEIEFEAEEDEREFEVELEWSDREEAD